MKFERPSWDESFMLVAILAATRSSCLIRQCGAALVKRKRVIASGYNGAGPNIRTCLENGVCLYQSLAHQDSEKGLGLYTDLKEQRKSLCHVVHAEENALNQCSRYGPVADGSTMYITNFPCPHCAGSVIIPNGIVKIVVWKDYLRNKLLTMDEYSASKRLLDEAKIEIVKLDLTRERMREIFELTFSVGDRLEYRFNPDQMLFHLE
jgi:dCMP deaminase